MKKIQEKDRFIHVPYHNFDSFIRVLQEAAVSKQVTSIKITLYRLAKESKVVKALIGAARNGKKVTVVIELLARFDEASNINWSKKMQDAGIKVIFGVEGLKVHSKITHIEMKRTGYCLYQYRKLPRRKRQDVHRLHVDDSLSQNREGCKSGVRIH